MYELLVGEVREFGILKFANEREEELFWQEIEEALRCVEETKEAIEQGGHKDVQQTTGLGRTNDILN